MKRQPHSATTLKKWRGEESPSVLRRRGCQVSGTLTLPEGTATNIPATIFSFPLIQAQYARIDVANNWFVGWTAPGPIGLSEVRFAQTVPVPVPESSSGLGLLALGLLGTAAAFKHHWN